MSRSGLAVVGKWDSKMGYSPREIHYLAYLEKKKIFYFKISRKNFFEKDFPPNDKIEIVIIKKIYRFKSRYFVTQNYGLHHLQQKIKSFILKKKYFRKIKINNLHQNLIQFTMSPPIQGVALLQKGGFNYQELFSLNERGFSQIQSN